MKKTLITLLLIIIAFPITSVAEGEIEKPANANILEGQDTATLTWNKPTNLGFAETVIFRSSIPIENFFTYEAVEGLSDKIYTGNDETFTDTELAENLSYYYILFNLDKSGNNSRSVILEKLPIADGKDNIINTDVPIDENVTSLSGATSQTVNQVSSHEAGIVYNYNKIENIEQSTESRRLSLFIIVKSPHDLNDNDKNAISYFIHAGTPTTILLGNGERTGVLNSYLSAFNKLPRNTLEWQDVIKIANGRWPTERNLEQEEKATDDFFSYIYERKPDMNNPKDSSAITIIAYGLRPAQRNLESEKNAINIYQSIFDRNPTEASDWDLVRAIAYSGATR